MKKGFLLSSSGGSTRATRGIVASLATAAATASQLESKSVDNLLAAASVRQQLAAGARALRIEADFVTCSQ